MVFTIAHTPGDWSGAAFKDCPVGPVKAVPFKSAIRKGECKFMSEREEVLGPDTEGDYPNFDVKIDAAMICDHASPTLGAALFGYDLLNR